MKLINTRSMLLELIVKYRTRPNFNFLKQNIDKIVQGKS